MKRYLVMALAALALAIAAPSAFATRVIFDPPAPNDSLPPPSSPFCTHNDPCNIGVLGHTYQLDFLPCGDILGVDTGNNSWCLWMNNVTGHSATTATFQFIVPGGGSASGGDLECSSIPATLATNDCPQALPDPGSLFTVSFFANPLLPNRTDFYLFTDFVNSPGQANVTLSVPEPGALGMLGLGLLVLGVGFGWQKRRQAQACGSNEVA